MATAQLQTLQTNLRQEAEVLKQWQTDSQKAQQAQSQFTTQQQENELVLRELELLAEDAAVYKLVGPVLIRQDQYEAKANVQKRLDFIAGEITSLDSQLKSLEEKRQRKQQQVMKIQQEAQRLQAPAS